MQPHGCMLHLCKMELVFKALADSSRRALLDQLYRGNGQTLTALCRHLDMCRQAVSKHLRILTRADLIVPLWRGREKFSLFESGAVEANLRSLDRKVSSGVSWRVGTRLEKGFWPNRPQMGISPVQASLPHQFRGRLFARESLPT